MADMLTFGEAVQRAGVSRQRLNRAIHTGRLPGERGGGPGKPTRVKLEDLQAWCASEGLSMPVAAERPERSITISPDPSSELARLQAEHALASLMAPYIERLERSMAQAIEQAVDRVVERLAERLMAQRTPHQERSMERSASVPAISPTRGEKAEVFTRIRHLQGEGLSLQAIANRLNAEGIPTLSRKGSWEKGTISNLLKE